MTRFLIRLNVDKVKSYYENDNFGCLIFASLNGKCYGFSLDIKNKHDTAFNILQDEDDFTVIGWKVAGKLPTWVNDASNLSTRNKSEEIHGNEEDEDENEKDDEKDNRKEMEEDEEDEGKVKEKEEDKEDDGEDKDDDEDEEKEEKEKEEENYKEFFELTSCKDKNKIKKKKSGNKKQVKKDSNGSKTMNDI